MYRISIHPNIKAILHILLTSSFSLLLLQLFSCQPEENCPERETKYSQYNISEDDKSKIPFTGTDTLVYISNDGDTAILYGRGKKAFIDEVVAKTSINPACPHYDYDYFENIEFLYRGNNAELNRIFIDFNASVNSPKQTNADFTIGSVNYSTYLGALNHPLNYEDSTIINLRTFYGIKIGGEQNLPYLYNHEYGIIKLQLLIKPG